MLSTTPDSQGQGRLRDLGVVGLVLQIEVTSWEEEGTTPAIDVVWKELWPAQVTDSVICL
jgi:hypothetical protein